jgi:hypothetical protein
MMVKNITEVTIYESPDGGKTIYSRKNGSAQKQLHSMSSELEQDLERINKEEQWLAILRESERCPALQEAVERAIIIYELVKEEEPILWHPV